MPTKYTIEDAPAKDGTSAQAAYSVEDEYPVPVAPTGVLRAPTQRERFLNPEFYPVGAHGESVGENLYNLAQRAGVGVFQLANAAVNPRQTVAGILASLLPEPAVRAANRLVELENRVPGARYLTTRLPEGTTNPVRQAYEALRPGGWQAVGNVAPAVGQALGGEVAALAGPEILAGTRAGTERVARAATDTGEAPIKALVEKTQAENEKIAAVNRDRLARQQRDQAAANEKHRSELLKLKQQYDQSVRDAQEKTRTGTAEDRAKFQSRQLAAKQKYEQSVRDAQAEHTASRAKIEQANAEAQRKQARSIGKVAQHNRELAAVEQARAANAAQSQVVGAQLIYRVNQLDRALRDRAGQMYDAIREKVGNAALPGTDLATAAQTALSAVKGTSETPKVFRDIASKFPESEPQFIEYQGAKIPRGTPLYDVLAQHGAAEVPPVTFADLQGYYSELGKELSKGTLPGDVYQATRALQDSVGGMMQRLADSAGVGRQLTSARKFYREYMDAFHEPTGPSSSGSPVAQTLLAKDPLVAIGKFASESGDRGIVLLRRYDPNLANLAQEAKRLGEERFGAGGKPKSVAEIPPVEQRTVPAGPALPLPPVLENAPLPRAAELPLPPVLPEPTSVSVELQPSRIISAPDLVAARKAAAEARANAVWTRGRWAATLPIFQAMRAIWGGHIPSLPMMGLETAGALATVKAATSLLRYPPMIEFLTKARPEDVELIPQELRGDLPGLVSIAQQQGIKVTPALVGAAAQIAQSAQPAPSASAPTRFTGEPQ